MSDIFLSYSRDDQATARRFAEAFQREGLTVWWDQTLKPGEAYDRVTEKALQDAKAVVVLWSRKSVESHWVRSEATQAQTNGTLVPVMIEPCKRPIMFELMHTAELAHWKGDPNDSAWRTFLGDVRKFIGQNPAQPAAIAAQPPVRSRRHTVQILAMCAVIALLFGAPFWVLHHRAAESTVPVSPAANPIRLGVLPFSILSSDTDQAYLSEGLAEDLAIQLNQIRALRALGPASTRRFAESKEDPRAIATALDVANLVMGTVRRNQQKWIFTVNLIDGRDGTPRWQEHYEGEDVFSLQEKIVKDVAQAVGVVLGVTDYSRAQGGTENVKAYEQFMRARYVWRGGGTPFETVPFLREAVRLDPDYNRAWLPLYLSLRTAISVFPGDAVAGWRQEREEAASHLDRMPKESMLALRYRAMRMVEQHKWAEAVAAAEAAVAAAPANDFDANYVLGLVLLCVGRLDASIPYLRRAVEAEPLHAETTWVFQGALRAAGREADANAEDARVRSLGVKSNLPDKPPPWDEAELRKTIAESPETTLNLAFFWGSRVPRDTESFKGFVSDMGLVDYWRTSDKWSDFCKPVGKSDFECH
jgi:TolB-like protein